MTRLSLEETMNQLKARLEESEYKRALVCEALENLLDTTTSNAKEFYDLRQAARRALNGIGE